MEEARGPCSLVIVTMAGTQGRAINYLACPRHSVRQRCCTRSNVTTDPTGMVARSIGRRKPSPNLDDPAEVAPLPSMESTAAVLYGSVRTTGLLVITRVPAVGPRPRKRG